LDRELGGVEAVIGKAEVDKDFLAVDQFLGDHTGPAEHGKTSVLEFLGVEFQEGFLVFRCKTKRVEADVTREVVWLQDTARAEDITRFSPSLEGTVEFEGANDNGKELEKLRADGADFIQVTDGRADILVVGLEERVELDGFLSDEHTKSSKHGDTPVLKLGFTVLLHGVEVRVGSVAKGIEVRNRVDASGNSESKGARVFGQRLRSHRRTKSSDRGERESGKEELHGGFCFE